MWLVWLLTHRKHDLFITVCVVWPSFLTAGTVTFLLSWLSISSTPDQKYKSWIVERHLPCATESLRGNSALLRLLRLSVFQFSFHYCQKQARDWNRYNKKAGQLEASTKIQSTFSLNRDDGWYSLNRDKRKQQWKGLQRSRLCNKSQYRLLPALRMFGVFHSF